MKSIFDNKEISEVFSYRGITMVRDCLKFKCCKCHDRTDYYAITFKNYFCSEECVDREIALRGRDDDF